MTTSYKKIAQSLLPDITIIGAFFTLAALGVELLIPGIFSLQKILFVAIAVTLGSSLLYREDKDPDMKQEQKEDGGGTITTTSKVLTILLSSASLVLLIIATQGFPTIAQIILIIACIAIIILFVRSRGDNE